ncbi:super-infection exclusion protein B [Vreelandella titanicae]|uniref:super-infection exclusion protein B n=1 Tax=Halomonadaceae TaxID=28256 RepID=UPI0039C9F9CC
MFSKDDFLKQLSLLYFKESYTLWIGIAFLLSIGMSIIAAFEFIMEKYKAYRHKKEEAANKKQTELENELRKAAMIF